MIGTDGDDTAGGLRALRVGVTLGSTRALHDVSFAPAPGWTAVVGPNGAGKSTLLRVLAGLQAVDAGEVRLGGRHLAAVPARERATQIAWLAQQDEASGDLTVREVVELGRLPRFGLFGAPDEADRTRVGAAMAEAGCGGWDRRRLHQLSGGERQRVLLARALAVDAAWLLLDEPTTHLDPKHQLATVRSMRRRAAAGTRVVSVLHDVALALFADTLVVMQAGRLRAHGASDEPALHAALIDAFDGALRIERLGERWIAVPELGER